MVVVQRQLVLYALTTDEVIPSGGTKTTSTLSLTTNEVIPSQQSCQPQLDLSNKGRAAIRII